MECLFGVFEVWEKLSSHVESFPLDDCKSWVLLLLRDSPGLEVCDSDLEVAMKSDSADPAESLELLQSRASESWVAGHHGYHGGTVVHHNPPGMRGGPGHGTTVVHHNPPGIRGGVGHGTTVVHHHGPGYYPPPVYNPYPAPYHPYGYYHHGTTVVHHKHGPVHHGTTVVHHHGGPVHHGTTVVHHHGR